MQRKLGKYEILESIGSGATAEVYRALDRTLQREVALKILKPALVADQSSFARFAQEAQTAAGLFHPNIATVLDMGEAEGRYFISMRYIPGRSLDEIIRESDPLSWGETMRMASQIGEALDFAHKEGFLHRDVKPSNIIRTPDGDYVLTDFGLTQAMMETGLTSHSGAVLGTPSYIAPEMWLNEPAVPATDQYALACVVYEALSGKVLFSGDTPPAIMTAHVTKGVKLLDLQSDLVPDMALSALRRALAKRPEDRFATVTEFSYSFSVEAIEVSLPSEKPKSRRWLIWLGIGGGILICSSVFYFMMKVAPRLLITPIVSPTLTQTERIKPVFTNTIYAMPTSTSTLTSTPLKRGTQIPSATTALCHRAEFVEDITVPDDTVIAPGETFTKTWRLRNSGTCTWNANFSVVFDHGDSMRGPASADLTTSDVHPGEMVDISLDLVAPQDPGTYQGYWELRNSAGQVFGTGIEGDKSFWLKIIVPAP